MAKERLKPEDFTLRNLRKKDESFLKSEYRRLRHNAIERARKLSKVGLITEKKFEGYKRSFPALSTLDDMRDVRSGLIDLRNYLESRGSTLPGRRQEVKWELDVLEFKGVEWANISNYAVVKEFLSEVYATLAEENFEYIPGTATYWLSTLKPEGKFTAQDLMKDFLNWYRERYDE